MKKPKKSAMARSVAVCLALLAACSGCATFSTSKPYRLDGIAVKGVSGQPREHVYLGTSGEYLFWSIPLGSGRFRWNEKKQKLETSTAWFSDHVGIDELQSALLKYADSRNCDLADVAYFDSDLSYAGASYEGILGILFGSSTMGVSAVLVPRSPAGNN